MTRPEPGAAATAQRLVALGYTPVVAPCLVISRRGFTLPEAVAAVVITSAQAVPALAEVDRNIPVFCVGDATAGRLREAGFCSVASAGGTARELEVLVLSRRLPGVHLLAAGQRHGQALTRRLRAGGITVERRAVYAASPVRALPDEVQASLAAGEITQALFYSAETARAFKRLQPQGTNSMSALALSAAVAHSLDGLPWAQIHVAVAPTEADLLALLR